MQNHPHDSICGCSVDEVNEEMKTRFAKSRQVADAIYDESVEYLTDQVNTAALPGNSEKIPFVVWNTSGTAKNRSLQKNCICSAITICLYGMVMRRPRR